jgi:hypothetical protein
MTSRSHDDTRHIFIASGNGDIGIVVLGTCHRLDAVGD